MAAINLTIMLGTILVIVLSLAFFAESRSATESLAHD
jgi:hypothetical protein